MRYLLLLPALLLLLPACQPESSRQPATVPSAATSPIPVTRRSPAAPPAALPTAFPAATPPPAAVDTTFLAAWHQLTQALRQSDSLQLQALVDPAAGLWVLEQPGALPLLRRVERAAAFRREYQQLPLFSLAALLMPCTTPTSVAQLPAFDCNGQGSGRSGFAREGCFAGPGTAFRALDVWPYATVQGGTAAQGQTAQQRVTRTVLQTATGFRFHFGRSADGRWRLLFLDLRVPCSA